MKPLMVIFVLPFGSLACLLVFTIDGLAGAQLPDDKRSVVEADEVFGDDLYIFGDWVTIDGQVNGDVVAFARVIELTGVVRGDFIVAGQAVIITGQVTDDVRAAAQIIKVDENATIDDDLIAASFSLEISQTGKVGGDLIYSGYQAQLSGDVAGDVIASLANCEIGGHVGADVEVAFEGDSSGATSYAAWAPPTVSLPEVPAGLTIRDTTRVDGDLDYESQETANIMRGATIGGETRHKKTALEVQSVGGKALSALREFATLLVIGTCCLLVAPTSMRSMSHNIKSRPLASLSFGAVGIVSFVVVVLLVLILIVALATAAGFLKLTGLIPVFIVLGLSGIAMLVVSFWFVVTYLAMIVLSLFLGRWLLSCARSSLAERRFLPFVVGLVLMTMVGNVPYLGWGVGWLAVLFGVGALILCLTWTRNCELGGSDKPELAGADA